MYMKPITAPQTRHVFDVEDLEHLQILAFN